MRLRASLLRTFCDAIASALLSLRGGGELRSVWLRLRVRGKG